MLKWGRNTHLDIVTESRRHIERYATNSGAWVSRLGQLEQGAREAIKRRHNGCPDYFGVWSALQFRRHVDLFNLRRAVLRQAREAGPNWKG